MNRVASMGEVAALVKQMRTKLADPLGSSPLVLRASGVRNGGSPRRVGGRGATDPDGTALSGMLGAAHRRA